MSESLGRRGRLKAIRWRLFCGNPTCAYCRRSVKWGKSTLDHRTPVSAGGSDDESNLVLCCEACNASKGSRDILGWAADLVTAAADVEVRL